MKHFWPVLRSVALFVCRVRELTKQAGVVPDFLRKRELGRSRWESEIPTLLGPLERASLNQVQ
jgi:hypothetical protein